MARIVCCGPTRQGVLIRQRSDHGRARIATEIAVVLIGLVLLVCAAATDAAWRDRHFLPEYRAQPHRAKIINLTRVAAATLGLALILIVRPRIGRAVARGSGPALAGQLARISLAVVLALGVCELVLRQKGWRGRHEMLPAEEPLRRRDPRLGWVCVPDHAGRSIVGGHEVEYVFDAAGDRVRDAATPVDPDRPTVLFTGESYMLGYGLDWRDSVPAQVASMTGIQSANLAVGSYADDQSYLRLSAELPRFQRPIAVVPLFLASVFVRDLEDDRPHLDAGLRWWPARQPWRLEFIAKRLVHYHSIAAIDRGVAMARATLRAAVALAQSRQAIPLILVPQYLPEKPMERELRERILEPDHLPYALVALDPAWRLQGDGHPDPRAARAMALAIATRLSARLRKDTSRDQASRSSRSEARE